MFSDDDGPEDDGPGGGVPASEAESEAGSYAEDEIIQDYVLHDTPESATKALRTREFHGAAIFTDGDSSSARGLLTARPRLLALAQRGEVGHLIDLDKVSLAAVGDGLCRHELVTHDALRMVALCQREGVRSDPASHASRP